jgi:hypothetical protein
MDDESLMFPQAPAVELYDPLGDLLGAGDGVYRYRFDDAVKLAGHACPTVAGGFLLALTALRRLYGDERPRRGEVRVTVHGEPNQGSIGPLTQVITLLTGAAAENGFQGLGGHHVRQGLLRFERAEAPGPTRLTFERVDTGASVTLVYDPSPIPADAAMGADLQATLSGAGDDATRERFRRAWRARVEAILADEGQQTIREV